MGVSGSQRSGDGWGGWGDEKENARARRGGEGARQKSWWSCGWVGEEMLFVVVVRRRRMMRVGERGVGIDSCACVTRVVKNKNNNIPRSYKIVCPSLRRHVNMASYIM